MRPVREQLEHDRVIRLLQAKYKRKFDVAINPGNEQSAPVATGPGAWYPDVVLHSLERTHKLVGVIEVETSESVNNLEAMSQWTWFSRLRAPFLLYVPTTSIDAARRLCADLAIPVAEIWSYQGFGEQMRFTLVHKSQDTRLDAPRAADKAPANGGSGRAAVTGARPTGASDSKAKTSRSKELKTRAPKPKDAKPRDAKPRGAATKGTSTRNSTTKSGATKAGVVKTGATRSAKVISQKNPRKVSVAASKPVRAAKPASRPTSSASSRATTVTTQRRLTGSARKATAKRAAARAPVRAVRAQKRR
ncbi:MAG: hypothetical protein AB7Q15_00535 [Vicinamibacterales bacterium]